MTDASAGPYNKTARQKYPISILVFRFEESERLEGAGNSSTWILQQAAHALRRQLRGSDRCIQLGDQDFLAILPGVDLAMAERAVERIRRVFESTSQVATEGDCVSLKISIGFSAYPRDSKDLDVLISLADQMSGTASRSAPESSLRMDLAWSALTTTTK